MLHLVDVVPHAAVALVDDGDAVEADLGAAEVAVVGAGVFAVVELDVDHRGTVEADPGLDDAVLGGDLQAVHGGVGLDGSGLPLAAGMFLSRVCVPLSAPFSTAKVGTTLCQTLAGVGALEVVGEEELLLLGDWRRGDGREVGRESGSSEEDERGRERG